jgi:serine/threonine protein phosphatase PrpC
MKTEKVFFPEGLPGDEPILNDVPAKGDVNSLEEEVYAPTTVQHIDCLTVGETITVGDYTCTICNILPRTAYERYLVEATKGERTLLAQLWVGSVPRLAPQVAFLGQLTHRMLPERLAWQEVDTTQYLLVTAAQGLNLQQQAGRVGWEQVLGDYLQLVQLLKKIQHSGWAVLGFMLTDVIVQRPVVLTELGYLTPLGQIPPPGMYCPGYSAPELIAQQPLTGKEDIYTLGAIFYRLLAGEEPPEGGLDLLNLPPKILVPGALQIIGRTMAFANDRCDYEELLQLVRFLRNTLQRAAYTYEVTGATTVGLSLQRVTNQDAWGHRLLCKVTDEGTISLLVACIADGMGGLVQGEVASAIATSVFLGASEPPPFADNVLEQQGWTVYRLIQANQAVYSHLGGAGGTTLIGVVCWGNRLTLAHVGDSRAYLFHADGIKQLTEDHTVTQSMINSGLLTEAEARQHGDRNKLVRSIGALRDLPESYVCTLQTTLQQTSLRLTTEDVVLLCTDGVWEFIDFQAVYYQVFRHPNLQAAADRIVQQVLAAGAPDNATVVLLRCQKARST